MARFYLSPTPSNTPSNTPTITPSNTSCPITPSLSSTPTRTPNSTSTPTMTQTQTPTMTQTPTITTTQTPTVTTTSTYTPTPTNTETTTQTPTPTNNPTNTQTPTATFTPTPTKTPNSLCPQQLILSASSPNYLYGLYNRATTYTGGTFETAWYNFDDNIMNYGSNPDGNDYVAFSINSGSDYTSLYWGSDILGNDGNWTIAYSTGNTLFNGGVLISSIVLDPNSLVDGSLFFPPSGFLTYNGGYINYPASCPTPTPTTSSTATPTLTQTPTPSSSPAFDSDAATYLAAVLTAGGTLNSTISAATNTLFTSLKTNSLYTKLFDFYPIVGSTAASHSINAKSPGTYPIAWFGSGAIHSLSGFTLPGGGGGGAYGRFSGLSTTDIATSGGDVHISQYIWKEGTPGNDSGYDLCASDANNSNQNYIIVNFNGGTTTYYDWQGGYNTSIGSISTLGYWNLTRDSGNTQTVLYKNGSQLGNPVDSIYYCSTDYFIGAEPIGGNSVGGGKNTKGYNFFTFGYRLSASEESTLSTIINTFQTSLGRNTY
jgi:hypothetical protein